MILWVGYVLNVKARIASLITMKRVQFICSCWISNLIDDEIVQEWISTISSHYVMNNSIRDIATNNDTYVAQIQQDIKCGLAFIKSRYPHFTFDKFAKKILVDDCA
jgi:hypothetical protein